MIDPPLSGYAGVLLYDGSCGFCSRWVPYWADTLRRRGFRIEPLQSPWVSETLGLDEGELLEDLRLLLRNGEQLQGVDAYRHLMRRIWWAYPLFLLSVIPGLRWVFDRTYRWFASNRYGISRSCGLPNRPAEPPSG